MRHSSELGYLNSPIDNESPVRRKYFRFGISSLEIRESSLSLDSDQKPCPSQMPNVNVLRGDEYPAQVEPSATNISLYTDHQCCIPGAGAESRTTASNVFGIRVPTVHALLAHPWRTHSSMPCVVIGEIDSPNGNVLTNSN